MFTITDQTVPLTAMVKLLHPISIAVCEFSTQALYSPLSSSENAVNDMVLRPMTEYFVLG